MREKFTHNKENKMSKSPSKNKWSMSFESNAFKDLDYKDIKLVGKFVSERGKILPRKITGLNSKQQRIITKAVKRARQVGLLPFINYGEG